MQTRREISERQLKVVTNRGRRYTLDITQLDDVTGLRVGGVPALRQKKKKFGELKNPITSNEALDKSKISITNENDMVEFQFQCMMQRRLITQSPSKELNDTMKIILSKLATRMSEANSPLQKKRVNMLSFGLKSTKLEHNLNKPCRCVVIAYNWDTRIHSQIDSILKWNKSREIPVIFALTRNVLGKVCLKSTRQVCVTITGKHLPPDTEELLISCIEKTLTSNSALSTL